MVMAVVSRRARKLDRVHTPLVQMYPACAEKDLGVLNILQGA